MVLLYLVARFAPFLGHRRPYWCGLSFPWLYRETLVASKGGRPILLPAFAGPRGGQTAYKACPPWPPSPLKGNEGGGPLLGCPPPPCTQFLCRSVDTQGWAGGGGVHSSPCEV